MTYAQLHQHVLHAATRLRVHGVSRGCCVGLAVDEGGPLAILHLAVLWAGGYILPLDLRFPDRRLCHMLRENKVREGSYDIE